MPLLGAAEGWLLEGLSEHSSVLSSSETQTSCFPCCLLVLAELRRVTVGAADVG